MSTENTEVVTWQEALRRKKLEQKMAAMGLSSGPKQISFQGGFIQIDGITPPNNEINGVILAFIGENAYYSGTWDPDNKRPPMCFALYSPTETMKPHPDAADPQSPTCETCPHFKWGSGNGGKGKACKQIARVAFMAGNPQEDDEVLASEVRFFKVPVTSVRNFTDYQGQIDTVNDKALFEVVTLVKPVPDKKTQFKLTFKAIGAVNREVIGSLLERVDVAEKQIAYSYPKFEEEEEVTTQTKEKM